MALYIYTVLLAHKLLSNKYFVPLEAQLLTKFWDLDNLQSKSSIALSLKFGFLFKQKQQQLAAKRIWLHFLDLFRKDVNLILVSAVNF